MKNSKFLYLALFIGLGLSITSCKDDDDSEDQNAITITIEEPMNDEVIAMADCADVHIHIDFEASVENHMVKVVLHPEDDINDKILDYSEHDHDMEITFEQEVDLCSYASGTCFHLEVEACLDHDCEETSTADVEFCLE